MNIGCNTSWATWLLVATLVTGCATQAGSEHAGPAGQSTNDVNPSKSVMTEDEVRDLNGQPPEERRRRLDVVLASHPDDLGALFARVDADADLKDFPAVLAGSEDRQLPGVAHVSLCRREEIWRDLRARLEA